MNFSELGISDKIVKGLTEDGITEPTTIQQQSIPLILSGKDVVGMSKTGSGKTAAFSVPLLEKLETRKGVQVLIVAPIRELAVQISQELKKFGKHMKFNVATVYGGVAIGPQMDQIARSDFVVGTPGRLLDHLGRGTLDLSKIRCVVLDEADKMVEMGFIEDIRQLLDATPKSRQVLLFGATISEEIQHLKQNYMKNPVTAKADAHVKHEFLQQFYYNVQPNEKFSLLVHLLKTEDIKSAIIFCSTRSTVEVVTRNLRSQGIKAEMIHGKLSQNRRLRVMEDFNKGNKFEVLVASAVAARGLHIDNVSHIFNYDLSQDPQEYIHRVGRTARAGETGKAFTLLGPRDHDAFRQILHRYDIKVELLKQGEFPRIKFQVRSHSGGRNPREFGVQRRSHSGPRRHSSPRGSSGSGRYSSPRRGSGAGPRRHSNARGHSKGDSDSYAKYNM